MWSTFSSNNRIFTIGKSDISVRSDRNKMNFLRKITIENLNVKVI